MALISAVAVVIFLLDELRQAIPDSRRQSMMHCCRAVRMSCALVFQPPLSDGGSDVGMLTMKNMSINQPVDSMFKGFYRYHRGYDYVLGI